MGETAHINFIAASYAAAVIIVGAVVAWIVLDYRKQMQILAELDEQGVSRRPGRSRAERTIAQAKTAANAKAKEQA